MKYLILLLSILFMTACNAMGSLLFKNTMIKVKVFSIKRTFSLGILYLGIFFYFLGSIVNILLLNFWDYSTIYPLTSFTCVWTLVFSKFILKEKITLRKVIGILFIVLGVFLICIH